MRNGYEPCFAIEADGGIHGLEDIHEHDENRDAELERLGVTVLRFTNDDVMEKTEKVLDTIRRVIVNAPHPHPLPPCGGTGSPQGEGEKDEHPSP